MHPILFSIRPGALWEGFRQPIELHVYGVLLALGFVAGMWLTAREARRLGLDHQRVLDLSFMLLVAGLVGSRLLFILVRWRDYAADPLELLRIWRGGLVWYGGFLGAAAFFVWYARRARLPLLRLADAYMPGLALGHAIGRLGCLFAGCCHGALTALPWGIVFPAGSMAHAAQLRAGAIVAGQPALPVHPTQLLESSAELLLFFALLALRQRKRFHGQLLLVWLAAYPILRSLIELLRGDTARGFVIDGVVSTSQALSGLVALGAVALSFWLSRRARRVALDDVSRPGT